MSPGATNGFLTRGPDIVGIAIPLEETDHSRSLQRLTKRADTDERTTKLIIAHHDRGRHIQRRYPIDVPGTPQKGILPDQPGGIQQTIFSKNTLKRFRKSIDPFSFPFQEGYDEMLSFQYLRQDLDQIVLNGPDQYEIFFLTGPALYDTNVRYNTRLLVDVVQDAGGDFVQDTFTFMVSDKNIKTLGVIQYTFNYFQQGGGSVTFLSELRGFISFATGIFDCYRRGTVFQRYDNQTTGKPRFITIRKNSFFIPYNRLRMRELHFTYFRDQANIIELQSTQTNFQIFFYEGVFKIIGRDYPNTRITVQNTQDSAATNLIQTYNYYVSDVSNNTIGTLQYTFNFIQPGGGDTTTVKQLEGTVSFANGIFSCYQGGKVIQRYDNESPGRPRFITISKK